MSRGQSAPNVLCPPEPSEAGRRPIDVNRKRWAAVAAVAAVLVLLLCVAVAVNRSGTARPSSPPDRQAFGFDAAYADPDPLVLVVRYGDSSSCPSKGVGRSVLQESDRVVVTLTRTPRDTNQICTSNYAANWSGSTSPHHWAAAQSSTAHARSRCPSRRATRPSAESAFIQQYRDTPVCGHAVGKRWHPWLIHAL